MFFPHFPSRLPQFSGQRKSESANLADLLGKDSSTFSAPPSDAPLASGREIVFLLLTCPVTVPDFILQTPSIPVYSAAGFRISSRNQRAMGDSKGSFAGLPLWQWAVVLLLVAGLYASILGRLFNQWMNDPNFSHGIFVPAFAAFLIWKKQETLRLVSPSGSWWGLPLIVSALLVLLLGVFGAELFLSRASLLLLLAGIMILFPGWAFFRAALFPWAVLVLMIPIPNIIQQKVTFPLQIVASKVAAALLPLAGVPVLREGNVITLPLKPLEIAEACSGLRSLLTLITLAVIYGYLMETRSWVRVLLVILAIPIAVTANSFRIVGTGLLVQYWDPEKAEGFYHTFSGWLIFVVALALLFLAHSIINRFWKRAPQEKLA